MKIRPIHRRTLELYLKKFYEYYPGEKHTIFHFVKYLKIRLKNNKDAWIGVSGDTGSGKSLFTIMAGILFGRPFDLTKNVTYIPKGKEIIDKFKQLRFQLFIIDEAAKQMRRVQWQDKSQQAVNVAAMTERFMNNAVLLNLPNFDEFTKSMRMGSLIFRAIVVYRTKQYARIIIQRKSRNWRSPDPWGDKLANEKYEKLEKRRKDITNDTILDIERGIPNTIMDFIIPNLELILPDITDKYDELKMKSRETNEEFDPEKKRNIYKDKYEQLMAKATKIIYHNELEIGKIKTTKLEAATALGITVETFNRYLLMDARKQKQLPKFRQT